MHGDEAQRLHDLLTRLLGCGPGESFPAKWADIVGVDVGDHVGLLTATASMLTLPRTVEQQVIQAGLDQDLFLSWKQQVDGAVGAIASMPSQVEPIQRQYGTDAVTRLQFTAHALRAHLRQIPSATLDEIRGKVHQLRQLIEQDHELDPQLTDFMLSLLAEIDRAVRTYRASGAAGLQDALFKSVGALQVKYGSPATTPGPAPQAQSWWGKCVSLFQQLAQITDAAQSGVSLGQSVVGMLPPGG